MSASNAEKSPLQGRKATFVGLKVGPGCTYSEVVPCEVVPSKVVPSEVVPAITLATARRAGIPPAPANPGGCRAD